MGKKPPPQLTLGYIGNPTPGSPIRNPQNRWGSPMESSSPNSHGLMAEELTMRTTLPWWSWWFFCLPLRVGVGHSRPCMIVVLQTILFTNVS